MTNGMTSLFAACYRGHVEAVRLCLDAGAAVDQSTVNGTTPLWAACSENHVGMPCENGPRRASRKRSFSTRVEGGAQVGAMLTVRWMDGSMGELEPEEAYAATPHTVPLHPPLHARATRFSLHACATLFSRCVLHGLCGVQVCSEHG